MKKLIYILLLSLLICSTAFTTTLPYKYAQALDIFLVKLGTYQNNSNYITLLDNFSNQIKGLKVKYNSTGNVQLMIDYLVAGIDDLKVKKLATDTEDEFLVNLETITSGMNEKNSSSSTSGGSSSSSDKDNSTNKNCTVNIYKVENAYNTSPLVFTFYSANAPINGKYLIELDSQGNLVVENNKKENLYFADKNIANSTGRLEPVVYMNCKDGQLSLLDISFRNLDMSKYNNASSTPGAKDASSSAVNPSYESPHNNSAFVGSSTKNSNGYSWGYYHNASSYDGYASCRKIAPKLGERQECKPNPWYNKIEMYVSTIPKGVSSDWQFMQMRTCNEQAQANAVCEKEQGGIVLSTGDSLCDNISKNPPIVGCSSEAIIYMGNKNTRLCGEPPYENYRQCTPNA